MSDITSVHERARRRIWLAPTMWQIPMEWIEAKYGKEQADRERYYQVMLAQFRAN